ncbi:MAG TPA: phosphoenolpyruvate carboxykinase (ATP) [bacterium]|jgi:phosphoenolpyruvate carboxykinase (ATP)|nr:phosphoenolpyruvate carboxykinase (ATP) [bacterium]HNZ53502.1 phosphoenolpyruvate carboxykinase (ATP) [bacterium]HOG44425.1 phosphoenolpyruvate carboxykinase (ATP) [bacterium]HPG35501.1 phosphoenolpyruvate carboxykinase (ATP) [bacterium]HPM46838.1 phosphoenolpyruvate carboxykinase (ATP) [bacterium]
MDFQKHINELLSTHPIVQMNMSRELLIYNAVSKGKALITENGALATWTPVESTGRSPKDTLIVKHDTSAHKIDWHSPNNRPLDPEVFDMIFEDAIKTLRGKKSFYVNDRVLGADPSYALPVRVITDKAFTSVFVDNMFRPVPKEIEKSIFFKKPFTLIALPYDKLDQQKYKGKLRRLPDGKTTNMVIAMDFDRSIGIVYGSAYLGSVKKLMFTVMNFYLPDNNILPLHCSANEGPDGNTALLLGLSGTGKTTLSADPERALIGDDEHGWNDNGIANFENGVYAKLINLKKDKEPEIYNALFHKADYLEHGAMMENAMMYPDGVIDLDDDRLTPNSRASFPLSFLSNIKESACGGHPSTIIFLTADANGVLPPVARLTKNQAMLWFLMGYTSKLAGTETGITEPVSTFSRFFGEPFMPRNPNDYIKLLGEKMEKHNVGVYLVNTGWSGGPYGTGSRMDINITRKIVSACLNGSLENVKYIEDKQFHLEIPETCPGVDPKMLVPINTWENQSAFKYRAEKLAEEFSHHFDAAYGLRNIPEEVRSQCPGK